MRLGIRVFLQKLGHAHRAVFPQHFHHFFFLFRHIVFHGFLFLAMPEPGTSIGPALVSSAKNEPMRSKANGAVPIFCFSMANIQLFFIVATIFFRYLKLGFSEKS